MSARLVELLLAGALMIAALIHLAPAVGVLSAQKLHALYGVDPDASTLLLLRHRAVLFAVIGTGLMIAVFVPGWRVVASTVALVCMLSFIALAAGENLGPAIGRVMRIDLAVSALLGAALAAKVLLRGA